MTENNGELTREILRTELQLGLAKQTNQFRKEMDDRFKPVLAHISQVEKGELTAAQKAAILEVIQTNEDRDSERRAALAPWFTFGLALLSTMTAIVAVFSSGGIHVG